MEFFLCDVLVATCLVALLLLASLGALLTGLIGLGVQTRRKAGGRRRLLWGSVALAVAGTVTLLLVGYSVWTFLHSLPAFNTTTMDSEAMKPFVDAIGEVDRASLGFTDIPADAAVRVERANLAVDGYDVMLHIYADTSRTIAFRKDNGGYAWIGEQEIHTGPDEYETADGLYEEHISITYETVGHLGAPLPLNTVHVNYQGDDPRLWGKSNLTLEDVAPILEEWRALRSATPGLLQ